MMRTIVVCIGNSLVADDAFGCAVYEKLAAEDLPTQVRLIQLAVGGMKLLDLLDGEQRLIVVDAVQLGAPPGTLHMRDWTDLPLAIGDPVVSHDIGIREVIEIGRRLYPEKMPQETKLIGAEGQCFDELGIPMSPAVAAAVDKAVAAVLALIRDDGLLIDRPVP